MQFLLIRFMFICSAFSYLGACIHYFLICTGVLKAPIDISYSKGGMFKNLANIWCVRFVRRLISIFVRSPLRTNTLSLVNLSAPLPGDSGCIIAICHTPWKRLLVQWCLENNFAFIIGNGRWTSKKRSIQKQGKGFRDLRDIINYLQQNGRVIMTFDNFNSLNNCQVNFLGKSCNVSPLPVRLARIAKVPLITAIPTLHNGTIDIRYGPQFEACNLNSDSTDVMKSIILFLEAELKDNPGIWPTISYRSIFKIYSAL